MKIDTHTPHVEADWAEAFLLELRLRERRRPSHRGGARGGRGPLRGERRDRPGGVRGPQRRTPASWRRRPPSEPSGWRRELVSSALGLGGMLLDAGCRRCVAGRHAGRAHHRSRWACCCSCWSAPPSSSATPTGCSARWSGTGGSPSLGALAPIALFVAVLLLGRQTLVTLPVLPALIVGLLLLTANTVVALPQPRRRATPSSA